MDIKSWNMYRVTITDGVATSVHDVIDSIDADQCTSVSLAEQLTWRLKKDRSWPSSNARMVRIEWLGAVGASSDNEDRQHRLDGQLHQGAMRHDGVGFQLECAGPRLVR
jgi:hypothetical protein